MLGSRTIRAGTALLIGLAGCGGAAKQGSNAAQSAASAGDARVLTRCIRALDRQSPVPLLLAYEAMRGDNIWLTVGVARQPANSCQIAAAASDGRSELIAQGLPGTPGDVFARKGESSATGFIAVSQLDPTAVRWNAHLDRNGLAVAGAPPGGPSAGQPASADQGDPCNPSSRQYSPTNCQSGSAPLSPGALVSAADSAFALVPTAAGAGPESSAGSGAPATDSTASGSASTETTTSTDAGGTAPTQLPPNAQIVAAIYCDANAKCFDARAGHPVDQAPSGNDPKLGCRWIDTGYGSGLGVTKYFCVK